MSLWRSTAVGLLNITDWLWQAHIGRTTPVLVMASGPCTWQLPARCPGQPRSIHSLQRARHVTRAQPSSAGAKAAETQSSKVLHLMRHGTTEMNTFLRRVPYGSRGFRDPLFYDTRLTEEGAAGARRAAALTRAVAPQPELLVVSPLTRAIHTAQLAWLPHYDGPVVVEALARERVWLSSDCGRHPEQLQQEFQDLRDRISFDHLPPIWWWTNGSDDPTTIHLEPESLFKERVQQWRQWLLARPERVIAVVAHWGLLSEFTGHDFENCELRSFQLHASGELEHCTFQRAASVGVY